MRLRAVQVATGKGRSSTYEDIKKGLMVNPVKIGERAIGFPADEIRSINRARIAGATQTEIKELVKRLHAARTATEVEA